MCRKKSKLARLIMDDNYMIRKERVISKNNQLVIAHSFTPIHITDISIISCLRMNFMKSKEVEDTLKIISNCLINRYEHININITCGSSEKCKKTINFLLTANAKSNFTKFCYLKTISPVNYFSSSLPFEYK